MGFDFSKFLTTCKEYNILYIYIYIYIYIFHISDEVSYSQTPTNRCDWTDRKRFGRFREPPQTDGQTFQRTTTLHTTPHNNPTHFTTPRHHITLYIKRCCHIAAARSKVRIVAKSVSNPVITTLYDAAAILLQRHYNISQWLSRSFFK